MFSHCSAVSNIIIWMCYNEMRLYIIMRQNTSWTASTNIVWLRLITWSPPPYITAGGIPLLFLHESAGWFGRLWKSHQISDSLRSGDANMRDWSGSLLVQVMAGCQGIATTSIEIAGSRQSFSQTGTLRTNWNKIWIEIPYLGYVSVTDVWKCSLKNDGHLVQGRKYNDVDLSA